MLQIRWIDNEGSGTPETLSVVEETTVDQIVALKKGNNWEDKFSVRVNGEKVSPDTELDNGDRVSVVPQKITAA